MAQYWVNMKDGSAFCMLVDYRELSKLADKHSKGNEINFGTLLPAKDQFLRAAASQWGEVDTIRSLPYPAMPQKPYKEGYKDGIPAFCFDPTNCAGKISCPRSRSCCD